MSETSASRDRLSRLRDENLVAEAAEAAGLDEGGKESLEQLAAGLRSLPDAEASALLLRELDRLTYEEIAQRAGVTSAQARQVVYHARIGLQGDPEPTSPHCDEVRVAMSKAETSVRDRRSITAHLDRCPVCAEFADQLEQRPDKLAILFAEPELGGAAAQDAAVASAAGVGAFGAQTAGAELAAAADEPRRARGRGDRPARERGAGGAGARRAALAPLVLVLLLIGGGVALAIALSSGGGGKKSSTAQHTTSSSATSTPRAPVVPPPPPHKPKPKPKKHKAHKAGGKHKTKQHHGTKRRKAHGAAKKHGAPGGAVAAGTARPGSAEAGQRPEAGTTTTPTPAQSSAQSGYSERGGSVQQQIAHEGDLPSTGLQIAIVVAAACLLLALGFGLRRLTRSPS